MPRYPMTPELLDALPEELAELYRGLEDTLLEEICSRLKIAGELNEVTVKDIQALRSHGIDLEEIKRAIVATTDTSMETLDKLFDDVVERNQKYYTQMIALADVTRPETLVDMAVVEAIRKQTKDELRNLTQSLGFVEQIGGRKIFMSPARAYQWALDQAALQIESGAVSYNQAISKAVRDLASSGVCVAYDKKGNRIKNHVQWQSGHVDHIDVAARRAVMTGINQINQKYREQSMDYLGTDLIEVTAHRGARNIDGPNGWEAHTKWQGKIFRWRR